MSNSVKTMVYHKVADFTKWKAVFDSISEVRKAAGELNAEVGTLHDDPDTVYVLNEWTSLEAARAFYNSPDLAAGMQAAGVIEAPHFLFLNKK
ncbi:MAG: antibiotic biosynthesis monooxygenase [Spirosomataceae bacterium]